VTSCSFYFCVTQKSLAIRTCYSPNVVGCLSVSRTANTEIINQRPVVRQNMMVLTTCFHYSCITKGAWVSKSVQCLTTDWTAEVRSQAKVMDFPLSTVPNKLWGPVCLLSNGYRRSFPEDIARPAVTLRTHPLLVPKSGMISSYIPLPLSACIAVTEQSHGIITSVSACLNNFWSNGRIFMKFDMIIELEVITVLHHLISSMITWQTCGGGSEANRNDVFVKSV
jgi:hypothetical protein